MGSWYGLGSFSDRRLPAVRIAGAILTLLWSRRNSTVLETGATSICYGAWRRRRIAGLSRSLAVRNNGERIRPAP